MIPQTPNVTSLDPTELINQQYQQNVAGVEQITAPYSKPLDSAWLHEKSKLQDQYAVDAKALLESSSFSLDQAIKLRAKYKKKLLDIHDKFAPELQKIEAHKKETLAQLAMEHAQKQTEIATIRSLAEAGEITPLAAKRRLYQVAGYNFSDSDLETTPQNRSPLQQYHTLKPILHEWERLMNDYQLRPPKKGYSQFKYPWERYDHDTKEWVPVLDDAATNSLWDMQRKIDSLRPQVDELENAIVGSTRRGPSLAQATRRNVSPFAQGVPDPNGVQQADLSKLSDAELRSLAGVR